MSANCALLAFQSAAANDRSSPFSLDFACKPSGSRGASTQVMSWAARVTGLCVVGDRAVRPPQPAETRMTQTKATRQRRGLENTECAEQEARVDHQNERGSKRVQLRQRLERKGGASLKDLQDTFGWQPHTIRAAISGLRKAGHDVQREAGSDGAVYRIVTVKVGA